MVILFGFRMYGKVDQCPGLFYIATEFFHGHMVPLIPRASYLILDAKVHRKLDVLKRIEENLSAVVFDRGFASGSTRVVINLNWKSILFAYLRTVLFLGGCIVLPVTAIGLVMSALDGGISWLGPALISIATILCWVCFALSYRLSRPSPARAVLLAQEAGIDPRFMAEYFLNRGVSLEPM